MEDPQTPGPLDNAGTNPAAPPPLEAGTPAGTPPQDQPSPPQEAAEQDSPSSTEAPAAPAATGRDEKGRFTKNEDRAKAGAEGGWLGDPRLRVLPEEDRKELVSEPWRYRAMKEELARLRSQPQPSPVPEKPPVDPAEVYAEEMAALNERHAASNMAAKDYYREEARIKERFTRALAEKTAKEAATSSVQRMTEAQEIAYISQQPEINDPDFRAMMAGRFGMGGITRVQAYEQTKAWWNAKFQNQNGNGHKPQPVQPPTVSSVGGEMRTAAQPPTQPSGSIYEKFARTPSGKMLAQRQREMNGL